MKLDITRRVPAEMVRPGETIEVELPPRGKGTEPALVWLKVDSVTRGLNDVAISGRPEDRPDSGRRSIVREDPLQAITVVAGEKKADACLSSLIGAITSATQVLEVEAGLVIDFGDGWKLSLEFYGPTDDGD